MNQTAPAAFDNLVAVRINSMTPDPAIDPKKSRLSEYRKTRALEHIAFREGQKPALFTLSPVSVTWAMGFIYGPDRGENDRYVIAFRASCHRIEQPDGTVLTPDDVEEIEDGKTQSASFEWVVKVAELYGFDTVWEMGRLALLRVRLPRGAAGPFD